MTTYSEIKANYQKAVDKIINDNKVFFAFSKEQLEKGKSKVNIANDNDLDSIGAGGFIPKANSQKFFNDMQQADQNYTKEMKEAKEVKEKAILYELKNYECFYTGEIDEVVKHFDGVYTAKDIQAVFNKRSKR